MIQGVSSFLESPIVTVNGADVVVIPKPFAMDASGRRFELVFELDKTNKVITITGDMAGAQYPVTVDPTERVTNGGFETGSTAGWYTDSNPRPTLTIVSGGADSGTYYCRYKGNLDIGIAGYSRIYQTIDYTGVTSASMAVKVFDYNRYDFVLSDGFWQEGTGGTRNWYINFPGQVATGWVTKSATPTLTGEYKIQFWTYGYNTAGIDSISATGTVIPPPNPKTFSTTEVLDDSGSNGRGSQTVHRVESILESQGWTPKFTLHDTQVTKESLGIDGDVPENNLNHATLHWHVGHGAKTGELGLRNNVWLKPSDVTGKWGCQNKWVVLDSCYALRNENWKDALSGTHGIFGFTTITYVRPSFSQRFFDYAINDRKSLYQAYRSATIDEYKGKTVPKDLLPNGEPDENGPREIMSARVIFANSNQALNDHLPGIGPGIQPDAKPGESVSISWPCK